jgi:hypothetical protein
MIKAIKCHACATTLDVERLGPSDPCPICGSLEWLVDLFATDEIAIPLQVTAHMVDTEKVGKKKRPIREVIAGDSITDKTGEVNQRRQIYDRGNDYHEEVVTNSKTGEIIYEKRGRLSEKNKKV